MSTDHLAGEAATAPEEEPVPDPDPATGTEPRAAAGGETPIEGAAPVLAAVGGDNAAEDASAAPDGAGAASSGGVNEGAGEVGAGAAGPAGGPAAGSAEGSGAAEAAGPAADTASTEATRSAADTGAAEATRSAADTGSAEATEPAADTGAAESPEPAESLRPAAATGSAEGARSTGSAGTPAGAAEATGSGRKRSAAAEALAAAVRAVESGERSAASFFTEQAPARPAQPRRAAGAQPGGSIAGTPGGPGSGGRPGPAPTGSGPHAATGPGSATGPDAGSGRSAVGGGPAAPRPHGGGPLPTLPPRPALGDAAGIREVLAAGGAPEQFAVPVAEALGEQAAEALREDPWRLLAVPGVRPEQADSFARALLGAACGPGDERRAQALIGWLLERSALEGHTALAASAVREALAKRAVPDPDEALRTAIGDGGVLVFHDAIGGPGGTKPGSDEDDEAPPVRVLLGLDRYALAEESLADGLTRLVNTFGQGGAAASGGTGASSDGAAPGEDERAADQAEPAAGGRRGDGRPGTSGGSEDAWSAAAAAAPSPSAAELIRAAAGHGLVAHSGGEAARAEPAALVAAARALGLRAYAAAHSHDGRQRLAAALDGMRDASRDAGAPDADEPVALTVTGLLSGREGPGRDEDGALALDLLAVLDAPQLDVETAAMLVESLPDGARLVLSGDPGVLASAGPGRVFADLLAARSCPQVVSRTPDPGPIGELVSGIGIGELNQVEAPGKEVVIVPVRDAGEAVHRTVQLVADSVPRAIGVPPELTQVITPGHGGAAGTRALNAALKERLNPGPGRFGGFDPGDRVVYVPAPGRAVPGTVVSADAAGLHLDCAGGAVTVPRERVGDAVRHGWAVTAHQAGGTRWPAAVVVLPGDATAGLTRAWVYTAFSRGERHLSVVHGADEALPQAVAHVPAADRTTRLRSLLEAQRQPAG
ncbi:helix-hairpin-helix domain-containing protein [Streptomyces sp. XD-27]|uniref:helix-hairpin-helix domain-containing protein n=1 Tax=Streptomyces sp. XD-27 TaxID=3062779 RepID=UPI0026F44449|nr:helix-hairpin-helix domain-containing protein [Streptomyces sp. XD-27]WKX69462.1 helix-hairpin-helix domain-containing protein [Streptomyces sp. XD-27]